MTPVLTLVRDNMSDSLPRYAEVMGRTLADSVKRAGRGVTRRIINITPPAHSVPGAENAIVGAAAYRYGRKKIAKDMNRVFAPARLKGRRLITHVYGKKLATPISVATKELHPNVAQIYRQHRTFSSSGVRVRSRNLRDRKYWVDVRKFDVVRKAKEKNVGKLASGFSAAAGALDVPVQNWIGRHGRSRGAVKMDLLSARMRITVTNFIPAGLAPNVRSELERRVGYAIRYQREAMAREVNYYAFKKAQELAIKTRNFSGFVPDGMQGG